MELSWESAFMGLIEIAINTAAVRRNEPRTRRELWSCAADDRRASVASCFTIPIFLSRNVTGNSAVTNSRRPEPLPR